LNIFSTLSEHAYDRPNTQSERALFDLVQTHIQDYEAKAIEGESEGEGGGHVTSSRFKELERAILESWSAKVRSSIFGDEKEEL
jgi:hypothetical protein